MKKSIVSVVISICMIFNVLNVFGDEILQSNTEYDMINREELTEKNIIYRELQSRGAALLSDGG